MFPRKKLDLAPRKHSPIETTAQKEVERELQMAVGKGGCQHGAVAWAPNDDLMECNWRHLDSAPSEGGAGGESRDQWTGTKRGRITNYCNDNNGDELTPGKRSGR